MRSNGKHWEGVASMMPPSHILDKVDYYCSFQTNPRNHPVEHVLSGRMCVSLLREILDFLKQIIILNSGNLLL